MDIAHRRETKRHNAIQRDGRAIRDVIQYHIATVDQLSMSLSHAEPVYGDRWGGGTLPKTRQRGAPPPPRHSHFSLHIRTALFGARPPLHSCANQNATAFLTLTRGTVFRGSNHYRTSNNSEKTIFWSYTLPTATCLPIFMVFWSYI